ncbi:hypothetical protein AURDEDRAFT_176211 [Auricularia subglabra TFB-10046 SS5]|nr:hypothetical protein AURDEDRAFT_176211 [Auricularia subglabra TFB-10046 SS5]
MHAVQHAPQHPHQPDPAAEEDIVDARAGDVTSALLEAGLAALRDANADPSVAQIGAHGTDDDDAAAAADHPVSVVTAVLGTAQDALPAIFSSRAELAATLTVFRAGTPLELRVVYALVLVATLAVVVLSFAREFLFSFMALLVSRVLLLVAAELRARYAIAL